MCRQSMTTIGLAGCFWIFSFLAVPAAEPAANVDEANRWALLIGVDEYAEGKDFKKLHYCGADMEALRDQLAKSGFRDSHITLMRNHGEESKYEPSKHNIERQLDLLLEGLDKDSIVVIGFSGHGVKVKGQSYLCTTDADLDEPDPNKTMIAVNRIVERLQLSGHLQASDGRRLPQRSAPEGSKARSREDITAGFTRGWRGHPRGF